MLFTLILYLYLPIHVYSHTNFGYPQPITSRSCRLGGIPSIGGIAMCPGPCDVSQIHSGHFPNLTSPIRPAATFYRRQKVTIKYHRNNHGPGGFLRITLVPVEKMMSKEIHYRNAFHYSCWGAHSVQATPQEIEQDRNNNNGFTLTGGDGKLHNMGPGYYVVNVTIPGCVPDGRYVMGMAWYGGVGGSLYQNTKEKPWHTGLFGDYWSCAFVRIKGGGPVTSEWKRTWHNDMEKWLGKGCNAANNRLGTCTYEPCEVKTNIMVPWEFDQGRTGGIVHKRWYQVALPEPNKIGRRKRLVPTPIPLDEVLRESLRKIWQCKMGGKEACMAT